MLRAEFNLEDAKKIWKLEAFEEERLENAKKLLQNGIEAERVSQILEIPIGDVEELIKK